MDESVLHKQAGPVKVLPSCFTQTQGLLTEEQRLTVDGERDLGFSHSNPGHDGFTDVLAGVGLAHRLQVQLVVVAEDLETADSRSVRQTEEDLYLINKTC